MAHPTTAVTQFEINDDVVARSVGDETVLLALDTGIYFTLNPVGTLVWRGLESASSLDKIVEQIVSEYDVTPSEAEADVAALLRDLAKSGLATSK